jgi:ABC-2 type transport system permease protein
VKQIRSQWDISFPQSMMWGVLACAATFAITIVRERKQGTLLRLAVAPVTRAQILAGKGTACFAAVVGVVTLMTVIGVALGMRPRSPMLLVLATLCVAFCFVGIMMLISVIGKTEEAVGGGGWGACVVMAMFGGGMIPLAFMPKFMSTIGNASPVKWSVLAMEGAIWRGFTLSEMLLPCGILLAVGAVCLTAGTVVLSRATS